MFMKIKALICWFFQQNFSVVNHYNDKQQRAKPL